MMKICGPLVNPYCPCVANCTVHGKQPTVMWDVNDVKSSHGDLRDSNKFLEQLKVISVLIDIGEINAAQGNGIIIWK